MKSAKALALLSVIFMATASFAATAKKRVDVAKDVDTLGGNEALLEMAHAIDPDNKARIVQKRLVDRNNRLEIGANYGGNFGGDSYLRTQNFGLNLEYHVNPRWSVGLRYFDHTHNLTPEGQRAFSDAKKAYDQGGRSFSVPDVDYASRTELAMVSWYPIYGKTNLLDLSIAQFDLYLTAGGGQTELTSGNATVVTAGTGMGLWMTQHLAARTEIRYQHHQDQIITGKRDIHEAILTVGLGWLL